MPSQEKLKDLCDELGFDVANFFAVNQTGVLSCVDQPSYCKNPIHEGYIRASNSYTFAPGKGSIGRAWATQTFEWFFNIQQQEASQFMRIELATHYDLKCCVCIPIYEETVFLGVAELYSVEERDMSEEVAKKMDSIIETGKEQSKSLLSKIPFEIQVVCALMIPVCFLVVFSSILLVQNITIAEFLDSRKPMIMAMVKFDREISLERVFVGRYLQYNQSNGNESYYAYRWWEYWKEWAPTDVKWNEYQEKLLEVAPRDELISQRTVNLVNQIQELSVTRAAVRNYLLSGTAARLIYSQVYENSMGVLIGMTQNPDVGSAYRDVQILVNGRRYVEAIDSLRGCLAEYTVLWENQNKSSTRDLRDELYTTVLRKKRIELMYGDSFRDDEELRTLFHQYLTSDAAAQFNQLATWIEKGFRNVTFEELYRVSDHLVLEIDRVMMFQVNNVFGREPRRLAEAEAWKLACAVVPSFLATAFIVYWQVKVGQNAELQRQKEERMNALVSNFVPKLFLRQMGVKDLTQAAPGQSKEVDSAMATCDIRNFLGMCEGMNNSNIFSWLQRYFNLMTRVTDHHNGTIDSFTGDSIFSFFPSPTAAIKCSTEWLSVSAFLNTQLGRKNMIEVAVGLHYGPIVFGVFGDEARRTCTLVSPEVNFTRKLTTLAVKYRVSILCSGPLVRRVDTKNFVQTEAQDSDGIGLAGDESKKTERGLAFRIVGLIKHQLRVIGGFKQNKMGNGQNTIELFEIFQADHCHLKRYKQESKPFFEEAVRSRHQILHTLTSEEEENEGEDEEREEQEESKEEVITPLQISNATDQTSDTACQYLPNEAPNLKHAFTLWARCEKLAAKHEVTDTVIQVKRKMALKSPSRFDEFEE